ncbi:DNA-binding domain-containing protein, partial [Rhodoplanes roseus]
MSSAPFAAALLDPDRPLPGEITSHTARHPEKRFAVYRNNVTVGLVEALRTRFPATEKIVGEAFFAATAREFVRRHPPRSPLLMHYGDGFPDFLKDFPPAADMPWLADVARVEAARTRAYHAADAGPLGAEAFCAVAPEALGGLRVTLHPSAEIVRSKHPVVTIWAMNSGEAALGAVDLGIA